MKKTVSAALGDTPFIFTEEAYSKLKVYLSTVERHLEFEYREETMRDIEMRCAELLLQKVSVRKVVETEDVDEIISILGDPSVFAGENAEGSTDQETSPVLKKKLFRDPDQKILGGVASGMGYFFGINPIIIRISFILLTLFSGFGILTYLILWIVIPKANTSVDKIMMKGERIHFKKIEETIKKELKSHKNNYQENKYLSRLNIFNKILDFFYNIVLYSFKLIQRFIGALFILISGIIVFILLTFIWFYYFGLSLGVFIVNDVEITSKNISDYINVFFGSKMTFLTLMVSIILLISSIIIALIFLIRKISNAPKSGTSRMMTIAAILALVSGSYITGYAIYKASQFKEENINFILSENFLYNENDTIFLISTPYDYSFSLPFYINGDRVYSTNIQFRIGKSAQNTVSVFSKVRAYGSGKDEAFKNSQSIKFYISLDHNKILISKSFSYPLAIGYRSQKVYIDLFIPENAILYVGDELTINYNHMNSGKDVYLTSGFYTMTEDGLRKVP